jgi:O-acetyl-ADP-ribose deacetylase
MNKEHIISERIKVLQGDITLLQFDGIVNAANSSLMGGGGVDGAIHARGGPVILEECKKIRRDRYPDGLPTGEAVVTGSGKLPCTWVIHTVGPVWRGGSRSEKELLGSAYRTSLEAAASKEMKTLAFPAISTGVYGFPKELAGPIALKTIRGFTEANDIPEQVYLVFFSDIDMNGFLSSIKDI